MKIFVVAVLCALILYPLKSRAEAIQVNGTCEVGNCASPDILGINSSYAHPFDFTYMFANTDSYHLSGTVVGNFSSSGQVFLGITDFAATYLGNSAGTSSGADSLVSDFLQRFQTTAGPGTAFESIGGVFGPGLGLATSASGQVLFGSTTLPLLGPFTAPPNEFSEQLSNLPVTFTSPTLLDYRYTLNFGQGSQVGSSITINPTEPSSVPEPSSLLLMGTGVITAFSARRYKLR